MKKLIYIIIADVTNC